MLVLHSFEIKSKEMRASFSSWLKLNEAHNSTAITNISQQLGCDVLTLINQRSVIFGKNLRDLKYCKKSSITLRRCYLIYLIIYAIVEICKIVVAVLVTWNYIEVFIFVYSRIILQTLWNERYSISSSNTTGKTFLWQIGGSLQLVPSSRLSKSVVFN